MTDTADGPEEPQEGLAELEQALIDHFFLGLVRQLQSQFSNAGSAEVEDAVATGVEKLIKRLERGPVRGVKAYLAKVAFNEMNKTTARRRAVEVTLDERDDVDVESAEDVVLRDVAMDLIRAEVRGWENAHIKHVMLVYLDMLVSGDVLETEDVAAMVSVSLGEEISPGSVRTWKFRGLRKLREFAEESEAFERRRVVGGEE